MKRYASNKVLSVGKPLFQAYCGLSFPDKNLSGKEGFFYSLFIKKAMVSLSSRRE